MKVEEEDAEAVAAEEQGRREEEEEEEEDEEEEEEDEVGAAGTEPTLSTEERLRARRADTIKAKALEITKVARDPLQENHLQLCAHFNSVFCLL